MFGIGIEFCVSSTLQAASYGKRAAGDRECSETGGRVLGMLYRKLTTYQEIRRYNERFLNPCVLSVQSTFVLQSGLFSNKELSLISTIIKL